MKQIDFENGTITQNIFMAAIPMLVAQVLSLLYNIVDRIYIARIPGVGTTAPWCCRSLLPGHYDYHRLQQPVWKWRRTALLDRTRTR